MTRDTQGEDTLLISRKHTQSKPLIINLNKGIKPFTAFLYAQPSLLCHLTSNKGQNKANIVGKRHYPAALTLGIIHFNSRQSTARAESLQIPPQIKCVTKLSSFRKTVHRAPNARFLSLYCSSLLIKAPCPSCPSRNVIESREKGKCCFNLICRRTMGRGLR